MCETQLPDFFKDSERILYNTVFSWNTADIESMVANSEWVDDDDYIRAFRLIIYENRVTGLTCYQFFNGLFE